MTCKPDGSECNPSAHEMLESVSGQQGWNENSEVHVLLDFIQAEFDREGGGAVRERFDAYLTERADDEGGFANDEFEDEDEFDDEDDYQAEDY